MREAEEQIAIDMGDEYESALTDATQEEIIDLAGEFYIYPQFYMYTYTHFILTLLIPNVNLQV